MKRLLVVCVLGVVFPALALGEEPSLGIFAWPASGGSGMLICPQTVSNSICYDSTNGLIVFEGATANTFETSLAVTDPTADRTITLPDATGTVPLLGIANTWTSTNAFGAGSMILINDVRYLYFGTSSDSALAYSNYLTPDALVIHASVDSNAVHVFEIGDYNYDFNNGPCGTSACTNPTLILHSANQSTTEWIAIWHDQTNGHVGAGLGGVLGLAYAVEANAAAKTPTLGGQTDENGEMYTNTGDADGSTITLPNDPTVGAVFRIGVTVAQTITLTPGAGETLYFEGDQCTVSITSATIGSLLEVVAATGGNGAIWLSHGGAGWTCNDA